MWARQALGLASGVQPIQGASVDHDNILILKKKERKTISNRSSSPPCFLVMVRQLILCADSISTASLHSSSVSNQEHTLCPALTGRLVVLIELSNSDFVFIGLAAGTVRLIGSPESGPSLSSRENHTALDAGNYRLVCGLPRSSKRVLAPSSLRLFKLESWNGEAAADANDRHDVLLVSFV